MSTPLVAALQTVVPELGTTMLALLESLSHAPSVATTIAITAIHARSTGAG